MEGNFGEFLRAKRKEKGFTLKELGEKAEISYAYLAQLETGKRGTRGVSTETLKKLAKALDMPYVNLLMPAGHVSEKEWNRAFIQEGFHGEDDVVFTRVLENRKRDHLDLKELLEEVNSLSYNGWDLLEPQREQILNMLTVLFPAYAKEKRK